MDKKIKVGCIGLGPRGRMLFDTLIDNPDVEAYAVCDINDEALQNYLDKVESKLGRKIKGFTSYQDMMNSDVDAVIVATHIATHCNISVDLLNAGKHVLCEIPNISNFDEAKKLYDAVQNNPSCKFMVAEECCFWGFIQSWKEMYASGMIGEAIYSESDYLHHAEEFCDKTEMSWRSYMPALHYLTHNLGPLLYILDDTCSEISGFIPGVEPHKEWHPAPTDGVTVIKTKKGTLIKIFIGFGVRHGFSHNFTLYGSKGSLSTQRGKIMEEANTVAYMDCIPHTHGAVEIPVKAAFPDADPASGHGGADVKMMEAFVDCIINDKEPPLGVEFGINIAIPGLLADESSKNGGKPVQMPVWIK